MSKKDDQRRLVTVMVVRELARQIRTIADHRDITMSDVLSRYAGEKLSREYRRVLDEMHEAVTGGES